MTNDKEKLKEAVHMLKKLRKMVGFFMKREISLLLQKLEDNEPEEANPLILNMTKRKQKEEN